MTAVRAKRLFLTSMAVGAAMTTQGSHAEDATTPRPAVGLEEVTVTARRREESLQNVPITVTAISGEELESRGIIDFQRLADATPGITIDAFPRVAPRATFRGIGGSNQGAGADPSAVAFLDGVYLGRGPMLAVDMFDMQRVEVLKGPQGTLWGKNVVGGAVNYVTARPENGFEGKFAATLGEFEQRNFNLMLNGPLSESILARVTLGSIKNDGFRTNSNDGSPLDNDDRLSGRVHVLFDLNDDRQLLFSADATKDDVAGGSRYNLAPSGRDIDRPRSADPDRPGFIERETGGARLEYNAPIAGFATLTGVAAYRTLDFESSEDFDGTNAAVNAARGLPVSATQVLQVEDADSYSGEMRLTSSGTGALAWVGGLYVLKDEVHRERESETAVIDTSEDRYIGDNETRSAALFGELNYRFDNGLGVFGGARYTDEKKEYELTRVTGTPTAPVIAFSTRGNPGISDEQVWTWRAGGDYRLNDNLYLFTSVATGFKSGAFPEQGNALTARRPTEPENVRNYEIGIKTDWLQQLRANVSLFYADYSDLQRIAVIPDASLGAGFTSVITDTSNATIKGLEAEVRWEPSKHIAFDGSYTYLDATYDKLLTTTAILANGTPVRADLSGNTLQQAPKNAVSGTIMLTSAEYRWGYVSVAGGANYESEIFDDSTNDPVEYRKPRTLWDASLSYFPRENMTVQLWGHNLTDVEYRTHQAETIPGLGHFVQYGPPRQYGVTFSIDF